MADATRTQTGLAVGAAVGRTVMWGSIGLIAAVTAWRWIMPDRADAQQPPAATVPAARTAVDVDAQVTPQVIVIDRATGEVVSVATPTTARVDVDCTLDGPGGGFDPMHAEQRVRCTS